MTADLAPISRAKAALVLACALGACAVPAGGTAMQNPAAERTCYRTLGRVDCHRERLLNEESRQVGSFDWAAITASDTD